MRSINKLLPSWKKVGIKLLQVNITTLFFLQGRNRALHIYALIIEHLMQLKQLMPILSLMLMIYLFVGKLCDL